MLFVIKTDFILKFIFIYILTIVCALALQKQYEHIVLQDCSILITSQCIVVVFFLPVLFMFLYVLIKCPFVIVILEYFFAVQ